MSQMTLTDIPYVNLNLFSEYYLDERVPKFTLLGHEGLYLNTKAEFIGKQVPPSRLGRPIDKWGDLGMVFLGKQLRR